jgi:uncharacterized membrane protein YphA (DoxX/SURF4 family)
MAEKKNSMATGLLVMRITSGLFFLMFGVMKFADLSGFATKYLSSFGSLALLVAILVAAGEALGGLALLSGFYVKAASYTLAVIMAGSIVLAHNFFIDPSQMMTGLVRVVLIGYYVGLGMISSNKSF